MAQAASYRATSYLSGSALAVLIALATSTAANAAACGSGDFKTWLASFKTEAAASGIPAATLDASLNGLTPDPSVIQRDHGQKVFDQSFEQFSGRMIPPRLSKGKIMLGSYGSLLERIEDAYGVPGEVLVAIWGLETDFGVNIGKFQTLRSLATLAYDCRRSDLFQSELMAALRIIAHGDLQPADMHGAWAGEIGQTQLMPSSYEKYAVDFDENGRRDMLKSPADALASTANFLKSKGWKKGEDWQPGTANFDVIKQWNDSDIYARTIAAFATQLTHNE